MALRATIYKADLNIADNDRGYYGSHSLTLARHPSETDERMMVRMLAYALFADSSEALEFTRGLSATEEPDLWRKDLTGAVVQWIEIGLPDERRILKACGRADEVIVMAYGRNAGLWWQGVQNKVARSDKLSVYILDAEETVALADLAARKMTLNINVQDADVWVSCDEGSASVHLRKLR
ncbi:MAG TPA: YaeQ family protein [Pusillimonas sp.]|uniref:YaeQ family protein n=1 Tax=Pusillimonas sp. TaxID=3040095 RepID=UPI002B688DE7|nr:YaeQ family protein [Pusillimonas sp.]HUH86864.1 YaeQ family protein [Pusillimonas sp.]